MMLQGFLAHPIAPIVALTIVLAGIGTVAPGHNARTSVNAYMLSTPLATPTHTLSTTTRITVTTSVPARVSPPATVPTATSSRHYSVPASLRGDSGEGGDGGGHDD